MPLYIPWLTETIKKRGVRYLLHHYLGQFFEEKLTLEQLSIDIYEGKGSIRDLALDVDGLNDELDFIPFKFLDGCIIGQISVEVPWSSLATDACRVELDGAQFVCRLKTSVDGKPRDCMESAILNRSLMTSSMQMAEDIVTRDEDDDDYYQSTDSSFYGHHVHNQNRQQRDGKRNKDQHSKQMFEGLEMFAQLIDSVLRRTKLTARNTLFRIEPQGAESKINLAKSKQACKNETDIDTGSESAVDEDHYNDDDVDVEHISKHDDMTSSKECGSVNEKDSNIRRTGSKSPASDNINENAGESSRNDNNDKKQTTSTSDGTVEFLIKFFRCEEIIDSSTDNQMNDKNTDQDNMSSHKTSSSAGPTTITNDSETNKSNIGAMPETVTKLLTLEDVEMRIGGVPVSNLVGKHTIMIKFNGHKSEISIFSGSPLLAVISHEQLKTFFNVFDSCAKDRSTEMGGVGGQMSPDDLHQQVMSPEDYAKIENQLLESVSLRKLQNHQKIHSQLSGRRWLGSHGDDVNHGGFGGIHQSHRTNHGLEYRPTISNQTLYQQHMEHPCQSSHDSEFVEPSLDHIEAFSCQLKLPGIWLCILLDGETVPPLIKPYADSICSFQTINKYIDKHIKAPHLRCLALKVSLDITPSGTNIFLGDLDISEHLKDPNFISPIIPILSNDYSQNSMASNTATNYTTTGGGLPSPTPSASSNQQQYSSSGAGAGAGAGAAASGERYRAKIVNNKDIVIESLTRTRLTLDPTLIDRLVYDYKLFNLNDDRQQATNCAPETILSGSIKRKSDLNFTVQLVGDHFKVELLCPIPDLTPKGLSEPTKIRPQSFLFEIDHVKMNYESDKFTLIAQRGSLSVKTQPQQKDLEAVKFVEAISDFQNTIVLTLEPSPSRLECEFPKDDPLNGSTMCGSIYVGQATESRIPTEAFATKRKLVRQSAKSPSDTSGAAAKEDLVQTEKILTPGDREHLQNYLNQLVMSTKFSINLHIPICKVQIEDKEQLDLIYNRFANDFVFWQPRILLQNNQQQQEAQEKRRSSVHAYERKISQASSVQQEFRDPIDAEASSQEEDNVHEDSEDDDEDEQVQSGYFNRHNLARSSNAAPSGGYHHDQESEVSYHSFGNETGDIYANEIVCKVLVDEISIVFNHQSCAAALRQEITSDNLLLGVVIDVNNRPNTVLSMVADNLELANDSDSSVLVGNYFSVFSGNDDVTSNFSLTAEIKRPTLDLKNIRLAIQLNKGLFNDFKIDTFKRFWQSINVTDEPILGYIAPKIITELHVNIVNTGLMVAREGLRPALLGADELYITSMVMDEESAPVVMLRVVAEEMSLYLKRNRKLCQPAELRNNNNNVKSFVCLIDSGVIDLDIKLSHEGRVEFGVINNVINLRACQDSLSALCKLITALLNSSEFKAQQNPGQQDATGSDEQLDDGDDQMSSSPGGQLGERFRAKPTKRELELLEAAMNELGSKDSKTTATNDEESTGSAPDSRRTSSSFHDITNNSNESETGAVNQLLPDTNSSGDERSINDDGQSDEDEEHEDEDNSDEYTTESEDERVTDEDEDYDDDAEVSSNGDDEAVTKKKNVANNNKKNTSCILDQSNPLLDDLVLPPLMMSPMRGDNDESSSSLRNPLIKSSDLRSDDNDDNMTASSSTQTGSMAPPTNRSMEESGFFVIGDDDVGAGILDNNRQSEPVIRQLIDGPITIIEDYFKITKPRTIPEMLLTSLERYLLEEMTLVVNLFGGHDLEDADEDDAEPLVCAGANQPSTSSSDQLHPSKSASSSLDTGLPPSAATSLDPASGSSLAADDPAILGSGSNLAKLAAVRAAAATVPGSSSSARRHVESESSASSPAQRRHLQIGSRRKHLSEGCTDYATASDAAGANTKSVRFGEGAMNLWESLELSQSSEMLASFRRQPNQFLMSPELKLAGGPSRQVDKSIQLYLSKIKCLYESGQPTPEQPISWRFILLVQDVEIRDKLVASDINKMLYEYTNEQLPRRSVPQLTIKNVATINPTDKCEECDLRVSVKPLRLNVDQDTLLFLIDFFTQLTKSLQRRSSGSLSAAHFATQPAPAQSSSSPANSSAGPRATGTQQQPVGARARYQQQPAAATTGYESGSADSRSRTVSMSSTNSQHSQRVRQVSESSTCTTDTNASLINQQHQQKPTHKHSKHASKQAIYIKSFVFSPDVPIRVDYHAKHMDLQQGALAGILMGLADLDHSELVVRRLEAKHGMRGLDRVLLFALNHWLQDIKRNQVPGILSGIGPIHHVIDLFKGIRDLILMPIEQYRRDKRLVRGLQKGASSFSSSTAMAAISLMNRFISIIQCTAQIAHDIVTPPQQLKQLNHHHSCSHSHHNHQVSPSRRQKRTRHSMTTSSAGSGKQQTLGCDVTAATTRHNHHHHHHHHPIQALNQPRNFCEGVTVGFNIIREGLNDTARNVAMGMQAEDVRSAVGGIVRQIPSTLLNPIISATEGAQNVLVGMRNQIAPDARREDQEKWKRRVKGRG